ncbi:lysylphosphatidylglycerol synthase transmembrane domain-containing protein [Neolewinella lacunae]|uniref:Flippase-like domain-containing protein n=1 Tax=Neolewinella lacunae TaxID=1517758 RepID=A0A923PPA9_9BACT|nr:lysylphosphatidylglycerol synthase transmembrane domain-containing protein [Neolewinella lacunae]MBC6994207.1 flippase-like domain-containing protein [Neolewinella lacunae]MDN3634634.1 lysylphosphatidylglycerol synthase transmembrane domain-containing protein [Neolewinella lacunae]
MNRSLANALKFLLFIGVGFGILYFMYRSQQAAYLAQCQLEGTPEDECRLLDKLVADFRGARVFWLLMTLVAFSLSNLSRAIRWNMLLRTFGKTPRLINAFLTINLGYFANLGFPRLGEILRPAAMARYENISLQRVVGTVVLDRMIDVIFLLAITALALVLGRETIWAFVEANVDLSSRLAGVQNLLLIALVLGLVFLALLWWQWANIRASNLGQKLVGILRGFGEGIQTIGKVEHPGWLLFHSVNIWLMYFLMTWFVFLSFQPTAALGQVAALVTFVAGGWGIVVPSPGGMGTYHFLTSEALQLYGLSSLDGFSWANISFFTINIGCNVLIGLIALLSLPWLNRNYRPE